MGQLETKNIETSQLSVQVPNKPKNHEMIPGLPIPAADSLANIFLDLNLTEDAVVPEHIAIRAIGSVNDTADLLLAGGFTECTPVDAKEVRFFHRGEERIEVMPDEYDWKPHYAYALKDQATFRQVIAAFHGATGAFGPPIDKSSAGAPTDWQLYNFRGDQKTYIQILRRDVQIFPGLFPKK